MSRGNTASLSHERSLRLHTQALEVWDEEAQVNAETHAAQVANRDPEAAIFLRAHVKAFQKKEKIHPKRLSTQHTFDWIALHARISCSELYPWMSNREMRKMHYPTFFKYAREATKILAERKKASTPETGVSSGDPASLPAIAGGKPIMWGGEVAHVEWKQ